MNKSLLYRRFADRASMTVDAMFGVGMSGSLQLQTIDIRSWRVCPLSR